MPPNATPKWYTHIFNRIFIGIHAPRYTIHCGTFNYCSGCEKVDFLLCNIHCAEMSGEPFTLFDSIFKVWQVCCVVWWFSWTQAKYYAHDASWQPSRCKMCVIVCVATRRRNSWVFLSLLSPLSSSCMCRIRCEQNNNESLKRHCDKYFNTFHNIMRANAKWIPHKWLTNIVNNLWQRIQTFVSWWCDGIHCVVTISNYTNLF